MILLRRYIFSSMVYSFPLDRVSEEVVTEIRNERDIIDETESHTCVIIKNIIEIEDVY